MPTLDAPVFFPRSRLLAEAAAALPKPKAEAKPRGSPKGQVSVSTKDGLHGRAWMGTLVIFIIVYIPVVPHKAVAEVSQ